MKILYAIQGTGNGHITVAREVLPILQKKAMVDVLVSGTQVDVGLEGEVKYKMHGLSFIFGKNGGIDYLETYKKSRIRKLFREIETLPVEEYDLVISDYEPVSAWACYIKKKVCIGFSHQAAVLNINSPQPPKADMLGRAVLRYYAPTYCSYGFHFLAYDDAIYKPVIRKEIRDQFISYAGHYTVYLPSYSDKKIIRLLSNFKQTDWQVFSKHSKEKYQEGNVIISPINNREFIKSMASCQGVLCNAGFQTPSEALFLQKKLMVIPMKGQFEQHCNSAALKLLNIPVLKNLKAKHHSKIEDWLACNHSVTDLHFPDQTEAIIDMILENEKMHRHEIKIPANNIRSAARLREFLIKKIIYKFGK